jgi:hypothetical protein
MEGSCEYIDYFVFRTVHFSVMKEIKPTKMHKLIGWLIYYCFILLVLFLSFLSIYWLWYRGQPTRCDPSVWGIGEVRIASQSNNRSCHETDRCASGLHLSCSITIKDKHLSNVNERIPPVITRVCYFHSCQLFRQFHQCARCHETSVRTYLLAPIFSYFLVT